MVKIKIQIQHITYNIKKIYVTTRHLPRLVVEAVNFLPTLLSQHNNFSNSTIIAASSHSKNVNAWMVYNLLIFAAYCSYYFFLLDMTCTNPGSQANIFLHTYSTQIIFIHTIPSQTSWQAIYKEMFLSFKIFELKKIFLN